MRKPLNIVINLPKSLRGKTLDELSEDVRDKSDDVRHPERFEENGVGLKITRANQDPQEQ